MASPIQSIVQEGVVQDPQLQLKVTGANLPPASSQSQDGLDDGSRQGVVGNTTTHMSSDVNAGDRASYGEQTHGPSPLIDGSSRTSVQTQETKKWKIMSHADFMVQDPITTRLYQRDDKAQQNSNAQVENQTQETKKWKIISHADVMVQDPITTRLYLRDDIAQQISNAQVENQTQETKK
ncbi:hypothetical protein MPSEU_000554900 [Mayamaea pseudoterrestris]|nr:hypothetical protein MPSEU_000554900 [Mayamaea pseudoterrestris]